MKQLNIILLIAFLAIAAVAFAVVPLYLSSDEPAWPFFLGAAFCAGLAGTLWIVQDRSGASRAHRGQGIEEERPA